ncbi:type II secretion system protein [Thiomicrorhabdus indica]|uniref:type II secretion system protein n=1 Tax=Thiomicrorhabdus indica TaxID=2267253 RepID=UPI002AA7A62D|nr:type II secretion system protein [Thiomicrorhabdus indica]
MRKSDTKSKGFTLVEISIVLGIVGIIVAGTITGLSSFQKVKYQQESENNLSNIKEQLLKFSQINKYLPCPDADNDGLENRVTANPGAECSVSIGLVPFVDIGLSQSDTFDGWNNPIRYVVNSEATDSVTVCDATDSASFFCNRNDDGAFFSLATPPIYNNDGSGNYFICNESATACSGTPSDAHLVTSTASIVLVAYGENFNSTMVTTSPDCSALSGAENENCDVDAYYHQQIISDADGAQFDDLIEYITGYEIKSRVLSQKITYNQFVGGTGGETILQEEIPDPTFRNYSLNEGDYQALQGEAGDDDHDEKNQDVIAVDQNVTTALDLGKGDDYVLIGNDLSSGLTYDNKTGIISDYGSNAALDTGAGDDSVYIANDAFSEVDLGTGNDKFVISGELHELLTAGEGDDKVWIQADYSGTESSMSTEVNDSTPQDVGEPVEYDSENDAQTAIENFNENSPGSEEINRNGNQEWWVLDDGYPQENGNETVSIYRRLYYFED